MIDHVPFTWHDLAEIRDEFDRLGLASVYGGEHDNGLTHMAVVGFDDRSYVELISEQERGPHGFWPEHIRSSAGPADWCVRVEDIEQACVAAIRAGYSVDGPRYGARERRDGTLVEWDLAMVGTEHQQRVLPFVIADRTPVSFRVQPSPSVAGGPLTGVAQVVMAVDDPESVISMFRSLYRYPSPISEAVPGLGRVTAFPGRPVGLVDSASGEDWVADRLETVGVGPCACLLGTDRLTEARERYPLGEVLPWPGGRAAFFESDMLDRQLGVVEGLEP